MSTPSCLRRPLTAAILAALLIPGAALAQTAKEQELEARIAQLEQQIQQLLGQQQQQQTTIDQTKTGLDEVRTAQSALPAVPAGQQPIQATTITPGANPGTKFTVGGFARVEGIVTKTSDPAGTPNGLLAKNSAAREFYLPGGIPVSNTPRAQAPDPYFDAHAKFSRLWFDASTTLDSGDKLSARLEVDFYNGGPGNSSATNAYSPVLRHAYLTYNNWLAGQTWSNFMNPAALIDAVDYIGPTDGIVFVRQSQLRYTKGAWAFSLENPETTVQPFGGGGRGIASANSVPDVTVRYTQRGDWGHVSLAGLLRRLSMEPTAGNRTSATGFGASLSGLVKLGDATDLRYQATVGEGIGRYIGLGTVNQDAMTRADGRLDALGGWAVYAGVRHVIRPGLRGNLFYATSHWDNNAALTGLNVTKEVQSWHANLIWTPVPKLDFGVEFIWGERTLESGRDGQLSRIHTMARYSF